MNKTNLVRGIIVFLFVGLLSACQSTKLKTNGKYVHHFKRIHSREIIILNDSTLNLRNNVSMMILNENVPFEQEGNLLILDSNDIKSKDELFRLVFAEDTIEVKNKRTLKMGGLTFKYHR